MSQLAVKTIRANGLDFAYLEAGEGPLILLLHGFGHMHEDTNVVLSTNFVGHLDHC